MPSAAPARKVKEDLLLLGCIESHGFPGSHGSRETPETQETQETPPKKQEIKKRPKRPRRPMSHVIFDEKRIHFAISTRY